MPKSVMKSFSPEQEELLRRFLFTNPHGNTSLMYPQQLIAVEELSPLMSAYSRTHKPFQTRVLEFLDNEKAEQTRAILPLIPQLIEIFHNADGSLKMSAKTAMFNREYPLKHGHDSIKEETPVFGYVENISDIAGKRITGHPLIKPQVKSTRYLSYGRVLDLSLGDEDILDLPSSAGCLEHIERMNRKYLEMTGRLTDLVLDHPDTQKVIGFLRIPENVELAVAKKIGEKQDADPDYVPTSEDYEKERENYLNGLEKGNFRKTAGNFVLDSSRVYLLAATRTSLGFSVDARTLEEIITEMISSPRKEDKKRGYELWAEAKKISPVLLGEESHIRVDKWKVMNELELRPFIQELLGDVVSQDNDLVNVFTPRDMEMYTDRFNAALVAFPYLDASFPDIMKRLSEKDTREILAKAHVNRGEHDVLHPAISHGGLMFEFLMAYHGFRDIFRHRRGSRSTQLLTTRHGFETPDLFRAFGLAEEYERDMQENAAVYERAREQSQHTAEKLTSFGANTRSLYSWQMNQVGYVGRLRGNIQKGNFSYVKMVREMAKKAGAPMPETAKYFRVDSREYPAHLVKEGYAWHDGERK